VADSNESWAVVVFPDGDRLQVAQLPPVMAEDLDAVVAALRGQVAGAFALVDVADEFLVVARLLHGEERFLLSDAGASLEWDLAAQVMDRLDLDLPDEEESEDLWPVGELGIFEDLGLDALELGAILADEDAYADEILFAIARRLGFAEAFEQVVDALV
jgi:putative tRNA adenosine deaminase-associated protein